MTAEEQRLKKTRIGEVDWYKWGPYISERQWGTVREDYSSDGNAWNYFPHDHARSRAYRWGEDGLGGITDSHNLLCFAVIGRSRRASRSKGSPTAITCSALR